MSETLPSRERALKLLIENGCSINVVKHCQAVARLALETAEILNKKGFKVDLELVEIGALLHDIGRSRTHTVNHAIKGAEIARQVRQPRAQMAVP